MIVLQQSKANNVNNTGKIPGFSCFEVSFDTKNYSPWLYFPMNFCGLKKIQNTRK